MVVALIVNFCCYAVYFVEFYLSYMSSGFRVLRIDDDGRKFALQLNTILVAWVVLTSAMFVEWLVTLFDPSYNTGLNQEFYDTNGIDLQAGWYVRARLSSPLLSFVVQNNQLGY